jgi:aconitate hydratase
MFKDPYQIQKLLNTKNNTFTYYSLTELEKQGHGISKLPFSIPILLENALRNFDNFAGTLDEKTKQ